MGNLFSDKYDDHFYSSKKDEEEQKKKEQQPVEETPEEREERELRELTYDRSSKRKRILIIGGVVLLVLGCGILDAVDVYGQYAHCAGWNGELGQFYSAGFEPYAFFGGEVLQAFVVVDENECAMSLRAV